MKLLKESSLSLEDNVLIKTALKACKDQINEGNWQSVYDYADGLVEKDALRLYDMITFYLVKLGIDPIEANKDWILSNDIYDAFDYPEWDMDPYGSIVFTDKTRLHSLLRSRNIDLCIYYSLNDYKDPSRLRIISSADGFEVHPDSADDETINKLYKNISNLNIVDGADNLITEDEDQIENFIDAIREGDWEYYWARDLEVSLKVNGNEEIFENPHNFDDWVFLDYGTQEEVGNEVIEIAGEMLTKYLMSLIGR